MGNCCPCISSSDDEENDILFPPLVDLAHLDEVISFIQKRLHAIDNSEESTSTSSVLDSSSTVEAEEVATSSTVQDSSKYGYVLLKSVLKRVHRHASQILSGETRKALIDFLKEMSEITWVVVGLGVVAYVLDQFDHISANKKECVQFLRYMCGLAKQIKQLDGHIDQEKLTDVVSFIVNGSFYCISRMQDNNLSRFFSASMDAEELKNLQSQLDHTYPDLTLDAVIQILNRIPITLPPTQGQDPNAVGIGEAQDQVTKLLDLEDRSSVRAVVLYGVGGIGKTTLATAVFSCLKLDAYKYCRINIQQDCKEFDLRQLQEQVLNDLFSKKIQLRNCEKGKEHLYKLFVQAKSQPVFLFIDNALRGSDLANLLPKDLSCLPNGSKLLITTRNLNETEMISKGGITRLAFNVKYLSYVASKQLLCLKALGNANKDFDKRMDIDGLVDICGGVPLVLEVVGSMLSKHGNNVKACESTIDYLKDTLGKGEGDLSKNLVDAVYETLKVDICKDAFLDIATYFNNWDKEKVSYIVGAVALKAVEDVALVRLSKVEKLIVHDIIQAQGRNLSAGDRINDYQSFQCALQDTQRLEKLKGIWLPYNYDFDTDDDEVLQLGAKQLELMKRSLRVLYIDRWYKLDGESNESFLNQGSLPHSFGHLQSLCFLHLEYCSELKWLPESFSNLSALKMLTLRGSSLNCLPKSFGKLTRLEELNLTLSEHLESLPQSFSQLSRLKKLNLYLCVRLSRLPDGFGQLKSLTHLNISCCKKLEMVSDDFEQLSSLCTVNASGCHQLDGKAMEKLVQMKRLMFCNIHMSPMLVERWEQVKAAHPLLVYSTVMPSYEHPMSSSFFHKDSKFLLNDGDLYFADWSPGEGEVGFVLTTCDLSTPSNKAALYLLKQKIEDLAALEGSVEILYVSVGQSVEGIHQTLLQLPCGTRAFIAPDEKTNMLFGYSLYRLVDPYLDKLEYQNTVIARACIQKCFNEKGEKYISGFELVTADVEEFTDIAGGFSTFFSPLSKMVDFLL